MINIIPFKQKSKFNPGKNDAAIEFYLSRLEEEILSLDKKIPYSNLTKGERNALYSLRDDISIIIKEADKGSYVVDVKEVYQKLRGDAESPLEKNIKKMIRKLGNRGDISHKTLDYLALTIPN